MNSAHSPFSWPETFPDSVRHLDIRHHAVFEASAGTGKTYAIEHLVLRLLVENSALEPKEILLLSFTEKTAADLRKRIRERLHQEWAGANREHWHPDVRERIHALWQQCEDLAIHTLHGFCHSALLRYPIANDALIRPDVLDDKALAEVALENLLRGAWAADPVRLARLREALAISSADGWRSKLIALALAFQEKRGDVIEPEKSPGFLDSVVSELDHCFSKLLQAAEKTTRSAFDISAYRRSFPDSENGRTALKQDAFNKVFEALERATEARSACGNFVKAFYGNYDHAKPLKGSKALKSGFASCFKATKNLNIAALSEWTELATACDAFLAESMRFKREEVLENLRVFADAGRELRMELGQEKRRRGAISYDDMTQNLAEALEKNPELAPKLRRLYKVCIVDEFQDTDLQQWSILKALCLSDDEAAPLLPLFLVGDPKQAIYSFRGGDLQTYLAARENLRTLSERQPPRAQGVSLDENFRSLPTLIKSLNTLFAQADWFRSEDGSEQSGAWKLSHSKEIVFTPVKPGLKQDDEEARTGSSATEPTTPSAPPELWIRDLRYDGLENPPAKRKVERELRLWVAARIQDLVSGRDGWTLLPKQETIPRPPHFGDIAILVRKHSEAAALEKMLRKLGIPCRVRRTGGVFQGQGADALRLLLDLLPTGADPATQAKILMLPFLRCSGMDWPEGRPAALPPLLERWVLLATAGRWPEFFESVLVHSGHLARVAQASESDAKRLLALGRALGEAGATPGTSTGALADRFDALRRGEGEGSEGVVEDGHEDTESEKTGDGTGAETNAARRGAVTVMTLHMSKGLEFPVVFVAAAGAGKRPDFYTLREEYGFKHVLDKADAASKERHRRQSEDEDRRLFYVAFTRAKDRLYAPLLPKPTGRSDYGPLGGFACDALLSAAQNPEAAVVYWDTEEAMPKEETTTLPAAKTPSSASGQSDTLQASKITAEETDAVFLRQRRLNSYSGLAKRAGEQTSVAEMLGEDGKRTVRDEVALAVPATDPESATVYQPITREDLPAGAAAGNVLHHVLEVTDFASVLQAASPEDWLAEPGRRAEIEAQLRHEGLDPECAGAVARAVWNTLRMPIPDPARPGSTFRLADNAEHLHEVEFLFPVAPVSSSEQIVTTEKTEHRGDFLWGFIDLVLRHEGRYYVLDWKSNLLDDYEDASVEAAMRASGYDLQWQLYAVAVDRWLREAVRDYDAAQHFGGVLYVYLRGAAPDFFSGYHCKPTPADLGEHFPARLRSLLGLKIAAAAYPQAHAGAGKRDFA